MAAERSRFVPRLVASPHPMSDRDHNDTELMEAWQAGDRKAGHELFTRHFKGIRRFFANKASGDTEELVQRTFARCVEGRDRFRNHSSFRTYLFGIARNVLREHFRRRGPDPLDPDRHSMEDSGAGPSTLLAAKQEQRLLLEALRRIPLEHQALLELYFWEKLPAPQIAEIFEIPENTVRTRIRRGKELVREQLAKLAKSREVLDSTLGGLDAWAASLREAPDP
jgi:RNA polymerase sigma factor (sigma-70 family)